MSAANGQVDHNEVQVYHNHYTIHPQYPCYGRIDNAVTPFTSYLDLDLRRAFCGHYVQAHGRDEERDSLPASADDRLTLLISGRDCSTNLMELGNLIMQQEWMRRIRANGLFN